MAASRQGRASETIGLIADACQQRLTTPQRLRLALCDLSRLPRRRSLLAVLDDVATGAYSFLEVQYLRRVERPHGLPIGSRQRMVNLGHRPGYRDVEYVGFNVVTELDGRLGHECHADQADDMNRDNTTAASVTTYRVSYQQVVGAPCRTAYLVATGL